MPRPSWKPCVSCLACAMSQDAKRRAGRHRSPLFPPRRHRPRRAAPFFLLVGVPGQSRHRSGQHRPCCTVRGDRKRASERPHSFSGHCTVSLGRTSAAPFGPRGRPSPGRPGLRERTWCRGTRRCHGQHLPPARALPAVSPGTLAGLLPPGDPPSPTHFQPAHVVHVFLPPRRGEIC